MCVCVCVCVCEWGSDSNLTECMLKKIKMEEIYYMFGDLFIVPTYFDLNTVRMGMVTRGKGKEGAFSH